MSHSSGIPVTDALSSAFKDARQNDNVRAIKVSIEDDAMVPKDIVNVSGSYEDDFDLIQPLIIEKEACYILFRLDEAGSHGKPWVMLCFVPDNAKVKDKMVYASSRSNLKSGLGGQYFSSELFGTTKAELTKEGYAKHLVMHKAEAPLTDKEAVRKAEIESGEIYTGGSSTYVHGVAFPVEKEVIDVIRKMQSGTVHYAQLGVDNEKIVLHQEKDNCDVNGLKESIHTTEPRFHYFLYKHNFNGVAMSSFVFIYSCPDGTGGTKSAPVKLRMVYSTSKANVAAVLENTGATIGSRLEISCPGDITEERIFDSLHPKAAEKKATFKRPARPGKTGAKGSSRITKDK